MPTDPKHERLRELFDQALDLPPAARADLLAHACADDPPLQQRIEALLLAAEAPSFLQEPTQAPPPAATATTSIGEGPGTRIGPYKLLQQIGEGGFGVVFMAEQERPVLRRVALKVLKPGMDTRQVVARFEQERQALAMMDHPHIAKVLDGGATATGRPYFVMELVKGASIVDYCDQQRLSIEARLALFAQVCHAVQHAHGKGVIHRDLKPSNVLVSTQDGYPHARVIDFGIAKATAQKLTERTLFTEHQQVVGTLQYMSPEQAEGSLDIDTRTDVYSLGVLLYELLTGSTPFDQRTLVHAGYGEMQRLIREVDPPTPSLRLHESREQLGVLAARRGIAPHRLGLLVRGELDWIVMKALEKDRSRRYETASALCLDIQRHLAGEDVFAAPPSAVYRLRKFVQRHRGKVAVVALVAALLVLFLVAFGWQAHVAARERDDAVQARRVADAQQQRAETEATAAELARQKAVAIVRFVCSTLQSADPNYEGTQDIRVTDAMARAVQMLDQGAFANQPEVAAELQLVIGEILTGNGRAEQALELCQRSLATLQKLHDGDHPTLAAAHNEHGFIHDHLGRPAEAVTHYRAALEMRQRLFHGDHDDVATSQNNLGTALMMLGDHAGAEPLLQDALAMTQRLHPGDRFDVAMSLGNLASARKALGKREAAEADFRAAIAMYQRLAPGDHPGTAAALNNLGDHYWSSGRAALAVPLFEEALAMERRLYQGDHPSIARSLSNLGSARESLSELDAAEALFRESLQILQRLFTRDHVTTMRVREHLGDLLRTQRRFAEAVEQFELAVAMCRRLLPDDVDALAELLEPLGNSLVSAQRSADAEPLLAERLQLRQRRQRGDAVELVTAHFDLGHAQHQLGRLEPAMGNFDAAAQMLRRLKPGGTASLARALYRAGQVRVDRGDPAAALPHLEEAVALAERLLPADSQSHAEYRRGLADCRQLLAK